MINKKKTYFIIFIILILISLILLSSKYYKESFINYKVCENKTRQKRRELSNSTSKTINKINFEFVLDFD